MVLQGFSILRILHPEFHSGCTRLLHNGPIRRPLSPIFAGIAGVRPLFEMNWNLMIVSIFVSLMPKDIEHLFFFFIFETRACVVQVELSFSVPKDDLELFLFPLLKF